MHEIKSLLTLVSVHGCFGASFILWPLQGPSLVFGSCRLGVVTVCSLKASDRYLF